MSTPSRQLERKARRLAPPGNFTSQVAAALNAAKDPATAAPEDKGKGKATPDSETLPAPVDTEIGEQFFAAEDAQDHEEELFEDDVNDENVGGPSDRSQKNKGVSLRDIVAAFAEFSLEKKVLELEIPTYTPVTSNNIHVGGDSIDRRKPFHWQFVPQTVTYTDQDAAETGQRFEVSASPILYACVDRVALGDDKSWSSDKFQTFGKPDKDGSFTSIEFKVDSGLHTADPQLSLSFTRMVAKEEEGEKYHVPELLQVQNYRPGFISTHVDTGSLMATSDTSDDLFEISELKVIVPGRIGPNFVEFVRTALPKDQNIDSVFMMVFTTRGGRVYRDKSVQMAKLKQSDLGLHDCINKSMLKDVHTHVIVFTPKDPVSAGCYLLNVMLPHWDKLLAHKPKPFEPFYDFLTKKPDVHLGMDGVLSVFDFMFCNFGKKIKAQLQAEYDANDCFEHPVKMREIAKSRKVSLTVVEYPFTAYFHSPEHFYFMFALDLVQEYQFANHAAKRYADKECRHTAIIYAPFLKDNTKAEGERVELNIDQIELRRSCFVYVKLGQPTLDGPALTPLPENTAMQMDTWSARKEKEDWWTGRICEDPLAPGRAPDHDICLIMTKPRTGSFIHYCSDLSELSTARSTQIRLSPLLDSMTEQRELDALDAFCLQGKRELQAQANNLFYQQEMLGEAPYDFAGGPPSLPDDKKQQNKVIFQKALESMLAYRKLEVSDARSNFLKELTQMTGHYTVINGAAGTGKTVLTADAHILLNLVGWRNVLASQQNDSANNFCTVLAAAVQEYRNLWLTQNHELYLLLVQTTTVRMETRGVPDAERAESMLKNIKRGKTYTSASEKPDLSNDPIWHTLEDSMTALGELEYDELSPEQLETRQKARLLLSIENAMALKRSRKARSYPMEHNIAFHLRELVASDKKQKITLSNRFVELQEMLVKDGKLSRQQDKALRENRNDQIGRVLAQTSNIVTTVSALGSELFRASRGGDTILWLEEASQIPVTAAMVPLQYGHSHVFVSGDLNQLNTNPTSKGWNAAYQYAATSILGLLIKKNVPTFTCALQHRIFPAVQDFVRKLFYPEMRAAPSTSDETNIIRTLFRKFTLENYQLRDNVETNRGTNFCMLHVGTGVPMRQPNGYSLQNYAEAVTATDTVIKLIKAGIPASEIGILSLYAGQSRLIEQYMELRLNQAQMEDEKGQTFITTIDSAQGQTKSIIVLVMVAAVSPLLHMEYGKKLEGQVYGSYTAFAKLANRLVVAVTRAKHGLIVVGNAEALTRIQRPTNKKGLLSTHSTSGYHIEQLVTHLYERSWICNSFVMDTNPQLGDMKDQIFKLLSESADNAFNREQMVKKRQRHIKQKEKAQEKASFIAGSAFPEARNIPGRAAAKESSERQAKGGVPQKLGAQSGKAAAKKRKAGRKENPAGKKAKPGPSK